MKSYMTRFTFLFLLPIVSLLIAIKAFAAVETIDDLPGTKIGVQMGTTGDTYAKDE